MARGWLGDTYSLNPQQQLAGGYACTCSHLSPPTKSLQISCNTLTCWSMS